MCIQYEQLTMEEVIPNEFKAFEAKHELETHKDAYPFQEDGINFLKRRKRCILADDMGLGKSMQALYAMNECPTQDGPVFIVVKRTLRTNWKRELQKWLPDESFTVVRGTRVVRKIIMFGAENDGKKVNYYIISYDHFRRHMDELLKLPIGGLIFDEAHVMKNRDAKISQVAFAVNNSHRMIPMFLLTGTPVMNRPDEIWSLLHLISPTEFSSYWNFVDTYIGSEMVWTGGSYQRVANKSCQANLVELLSPYILRRLKKDVLDLPEKVYETIEVELEGEQLEHYNTMRDELVAYISADHEVNATIILSQWLRLKQISVSHNLLSKSDDRLEGAKIDALFELLEDCGDQKVVVFSQFKEAVTRLSKSLKLKGINHTLLTGDTKDQENDEINERQKAIDTFQNDPECKIILVSTLAGGMGINLTAGSVAIFLDLWWNPAVNRQAEDRLHRIGQHNPVTVYSLETRDSIEQYILAILGDKEAMFDATIPVERVINSVKQYAKRKVETWEPDNKE